MMEGIDLNNWESQNHQCECDTTYKEFQDKHHKHVVTGNLNIIKNKRPIHLFSKGPNYRERNSVNFTNARRAIKQGLDEYVNKWSKRNKKIKVMLTEWKIAVLERVDEKITFLRNGPFKQWRGTKKVLSDKHCCEVLEDLQTKFCITPMDKASNNIGFVCKPYMISQIIKEVHSDTYRKVGKARNTVKDQIKVCI